MEMNHEEIDLGAIAKSETLLRGFMDNIPQLVLILRADGKTIFANKYWETYLGLDPTKASEWNWTEHLNEADRNRALGEFPKVAKSKKTGEMNSRLRGKDGVYRWHQWTLTPLLDEKKNIYRWLCMARDVGQEMAQEKFIRLLDAVDDVFKPGFKTSDLQTLGNLFVPEFADIFTIDRLEDEKWVRMAFCSSLKTGDADRAALDELIQAQFQQLSIGRVLKEDRAVVLDKKHLTELLKAEGQVASPELLDLIDRTGAEMGLMAPLKSHGKVVGGMSLQIYSKEKRFEEQEHWVFREIVTRIANEIEKYELAESRRPTVERLSQLTARLHRIQEEERERISRDIHDELGQQLTVMKLQMANLLKKADAEGCEPTRVGLKGMIETVDGAIRSVRKVASNLRPLALEDLGIIDALEWLFRDFERTTGIQVTLRFGINDLKKNRERDDAIFRVAQEALTNVLRHSGAQNVHSDFRKERNFLSLEIRDDGLGFTEGFDRRDTLGLTGMRERVRNIGGDLILINDEKEGAVVKVSVPFEV